MRNAKQSAPAENHGGALPGVGLAQPTTGNIGDMDIISRERGKRKYGGL